MPLLGAIEACCLCPRAALRLSWAIFSRSLRDRRAFWRRSGRLRGSQRLLLLLPAVALWVHQAGVGSIGCYADCSKIEVGWKADEGAMNQMRGVLMLLAAGFAAWKGWRIHAGPHAPLQVWTAFGLAALALGLAVWHLTRGVRD